jgi:hypothetical protein
LSCSADIILQDCQSGTLWLQNLSYDIGTLIQTVDNAHTMYEALTAMFTPDCHKMKMEECGFFLAHSLMQQDDAIRTIVADHPNPKNTLNCGTNYKVRRNAKAVIAKRAPFGPSTLQRPNNIERGVMRKIGNVCEECSTEHKKTKCQLVVPDGQQTEITSTFIIRYIIGLFMVMRKIPGGYTSGLIYETIAGKLLKVPKV